MRSRAVCPSLERSNIFWAPHQRSKNGERRVSRPQQKNLIKKATEKSVAFLGLHNIVLAESVLLDLLNINH
jgi:hypothetical protein